MPKEWGLITLIPIYKGKGDPMECDSYRATKLLEHGNEGTGKSSGEETENESQHR